MEWQKQITVYACPIYISNISNIVFAFKGDNADDLY